MAPAAMLLVPVAMSESMGRHTALLDTFPIMRALHQSHANEASKGQWG